MAINLMAGKLDPNENNDPQKGIDLSLERPNQAQTSLNESSSQPIRVSVPQVNSEKSTSENQKKTIKINTKSSENSKPTVPMDLNFDKSNTNDSKGTTILFVVIILLMVGAGALLVLLNSESQFLKGSVNQLPTTSVTQVVDSILAEEFSNPANTDTSSTDIDTSSLESDSSQSTSTVDNDANEMNSTTQEPVDRLPIVTDNNIPLEPLVTETTTETLPEPTTDPIAQTNTEILNAPVDTTDIISTPIVNLEDQYNLEDNITSSNEIAVNQVQTTNDFNQESADVIQLNQPEVLTASDQIQGETGPALWLSGIIATLISYHARKKKTI